MEARREPLRSVAGVGRGRRLPGRGVSRPHALGVPRRRSDRPRGPSGGHRDAPRLPGTRDLHRAHVARDRRAPRRGSRLRVQHAERPEPAGIPEDGVADRRSPADPRATDALAPRRGDRPGACARRSMDDAEHRRPRRRRGPRRRRRSRLVARDVPAPRIGPPHPSHARVPPVAVRDPTPGLPRDRRRPRAHRGGRDLPDPPARSGARGRARGIAPSVGRSADRARVGACRRPAVRRRLPAHDRSGPRRSGRSRPTPARGSAHDLAGCHRGRARRRGGTSPWATSSCSDRSLRPRPGVLRTSRRR